ncbi:MAG: hypothetical protein AB7K04_14320 [Pseudorhodoplanes sp.]
MRRVLIILMSGVTLASCSSSNWSSGDLFKSTPPTVVLRFESEPQGAEARIPSGQSCRTPCALAVPAQNMMVSFSLNGYQPQSVPVQALPPEDLRSDSDAPPPQARFDPNPVYAELQLAAPPPKRARPRKPAVPRPAAAPPPAPAAAPQAAPAPAPMSSPAAPWPAPVRQQ